LTGNGEVGTLQICGLKGVVEIACLGPDLHFLE
jgi:hypothetical protein